MSGYEQESFINVLRAHARLLDGLTQLLKPYGLSEPQYNVLRILRGAGPSGLPCRAVAERMITRLPDITRLVDRLERVGLIARERSSRDRRVVNVVLLEKGEALLSQLDGPVADLHVRQFALLEAGEFGELNRLLSKIR
jgi:DNA-binding MarR family transcriptional regulator